MVPFLLLAYKFFKLKFRFFIEKHFFLQYSRTSFIKIVVIQLMKGTENEKQFQ